MSFPSCLQIANRVHNNVSSAINSRIGITVVAGISVAAITYLALTALNFKKITTIASAIPVALAAIGISGAAAACFLPILILVWVGGFRHG